MEDIWNKACRHYEISDDVANTWFKRIQHRLSEDTPERVYHNWQELLLNKEELLRDCPASVVMAAFFQYFCFDGKRTCVAENCEAFNEFCRDANFENEDTKILIRKLLGDKSSELVYCFDDEANLLQDMDLAILGSTQEEYKRYTQLLRQEYAHMDDVTYKQMRLKVLQTLLMIPNIFSTTEFQSKYEQLARTNIKQEIEELKQ